MDRVFLAEPFVDAERVTIGGTARRHLADSLRLRPGDRFLATDGRGRERLLEVESVDRRAITAFVREETRRPPGPGAHVTLAIAPPKGSRMETAVEKATELGVGAVRPIVCARSVVKGRRDSERAERWNRVAGSAAAQSGRFHVPVIHPIQPFADALAAEAAAGARILLAHLDPATEPFEAALAEPPPATPATPGTPSATPSRSFALFVGPEGGFTPEEAERARDAGARWVSLGRNRLRTETAAIAAVATSPTSETGSV